MSSLLSGCLYCKSVPALKHLLLFECLVLTSNELSSRLAARIFKWDVKFMVWAREADSIAIALFLNDDADALPYNFKDDSARIPWRTALDAGVSSVKAILRRECEIAVLPAKGARCWDIEVSTVGFH
jgi:hypothetical protein